MAEAIQSTNIALEIFYDSALYKCSLNNNNNNNNTNRRRKSRTYIIKNIKRKTYTG